jgi:ribosomal protein S18 acetylase RimI-like enzyme
MRASLWPEVAIRRLIGSDLPAYKVLRDTALEAYPHAFTSDADEERRKPPENYLARLGLDRYEGGHFTLGAWHQDDLVGAISCERETRLKVRHTAHLIGMMVRRESQGRGAGRALLEACIAEARLAPGLEMLTLTVTAGNLAAIGLYERAGFVRYGRLPHAIRVRDAYHAKDQMLLML